MAKRPLYINIYYMALTICISLVMTACADDDFSESYYSEDGELIICCSPADYTIDVLNVTRATSDIQDDKIYKLDLLLFNSDNKRLVKYLSTTYHGTGFTTGTGKRTWNITGLIPRDYFEQPQIDIYLIANYNGTTSLSEIKNSDDLVNLGVINGISPYLNPCDETNKGITMVQCVTGKKSSVSGYTKTDKEGATMEITFSALERVNAKVQVNFDTHTKTIFDFEDVNTYTEGWKVANWKNILNNNYDIKYNQIVRNNGSCALLAYNSATNDRYCVLKLDNTSIANSSNWTLEFDYACRNASSKDLGLRIIYKLDGNFVDDGLSNYLFYTVVPNGADKDVYTKESQIYDSQNTEIGSLINDTYRTSISTWYHFKLVGSDKSVKLTITNSDNEFILNEKIVYEDNKQPLAIVHKLANYGQVAFDNITLTYDAVPCVESFKLINYTNNYYLTYDDIRDLRITDLVPSASTLGNWSGESGIIPVTGFQELSTYPMKDNDNFVLYTYPNSWFDDRYYSDSYEGMHKEEPVLYNRQTYLLVKSKYINRDGYASPKAYYYKVPINFRLPKYNDAWSNSGYSDKRDEALKQAKEYCRIRRNYWYQTNVKFDKPGSETGNNEDFYVTADPYQDITVRPEF